MVRSEPILGIEPSAGFVAVRACCHKLRNFYEIIHAEGLDNIDGYDWDLFNIGYHGVANNGKEYLWGNLVLGLGIFHVMVPIEHSRPLLTHERDFWSRSYLTIIGSHSGSPSRVVSSGVPIAH